jgi:hypothetical protein
VLVVWFLSGNWFVTYHGRKNTLKHGAPDVEHITG